MKLLALLCARRERIAAGVGAGVIGSGVTGGGADPAVVTPGDKDMTPNTS